MVWSVQKVFGKFAKGKGWYYRVDAVEESSGKKFKFSIPVHSIGFLKEGEKYLIEYVDTWPRPVSVKRLS